MYFFFCWSCMLFYITNTNATFSHVQMKLWRPEYILLHWMLFWHTSIWTITTLLHINVKGRACLYLCSALNQSVLRTLFFNWQFLFNYIALYNNYVTWQIVVCTDDVGQNNGTKGLFDGGRCLHTEAQTGECLHKEGFVCFSLMYVAPGAVSAKGVQNISCWDVCLFFFLPFDLQRPDLQIKHYKDVCTVKWSGSTKENDQSW